MSAHCFGSSGAMLLGSGDEDLGLSEGSLHCPLWVVRMRFRLEETHVSLGDHSRSVGIH